MNDAASYRLEVTIDFLGREPENYNRAAPEVTEAQFAAVEAAKDTLREHGFLIARAGHGAFRLG